MLPVTFCTTGFVSFAELEKLLANLVHHSTSQSVNVQCIYLCDYNSRCLVVPQFTTSKLKSLGLLETFPEAQKPM